MPLRPRPQERLAPGELPPPKVAWLHPLELARTAYHAWLSQVATSYLDRREVLAALDRRPSQPDGPPPDPWSGQPPVSRDSAAYWSSTTRQTEGIWIDFVADIGDSWEATHAVATLMAQRELNVRGREMPLPHADLVVLGGDLVYPAPTRHSYRRRTCEPLGSAFPQEEQPSKTKPELPIRPRRLVAIPGNHDWYDGLTSFVREFCQGGSLGGWQLVQGRSYFALKLMKGWWVWGIDIALDTRIDPAQQTYFFDIVTNQNGCREPRFDRGDRIILCTAKPSWLPSSRYSDDAYKNLEFFVRELIVPHGGVVATMLSGDLHHYSRYESDEGHQFITSGSGGSYLMGTHHLPAEVRPFKVPPKKEEAESSPYLHSAFVRSGFTYPSQSDSRRLALGALRLAFRRVNIPFCLTVGLIAFWTARMFDRVAPGLLTTEWGSRHAVSWRFDMLAMLSALVVVMGCGWFAAATNKKARPLLTWPWGLAHGMGQLAVAVILALLLMPHPLQRLGAAGPPYLTLPGPFMPVAHALSVIGDAAVFVLIAGWIGATLVGAYLTVSDRMLRWHANEVFAAQSICDYRSFVRIHLAANGHATIYPIGLRHVPRWWRSRLVRTDSDPQYEPMDAELLPHLIEGPIDVLVSQPGWSAAAPVSVPPSNVVMTG
jgi:hypothetical protein